jgi:hypothetical protein
LTQSMVGRIGFVSRGPVEEVGCELEVEGEKVKTYIGGERRRDKDGRRGK